MKKTCPLNKNDMVELYIESIGSNGEGIGRVDGYTLFVRQGVPGDKLMVKVVKTKKSYGYGIIASILEPSADRVEARCPVAGPCGGCSLQHMSYQAQLRAKDKTIRDTLSRIGGVDPDRLDRIMEPIMGADNPYHYRNKVQYPVRDHMGKIQIGFYGKGSHRIVETPRCYIQDTYNENIVGLIRDFMVEKRIKAYDEVKHKGLVRHIVIRKSNEKNTFHVTLVINGQQLPEVEVLRDRLMALDLVEAFSLNVNRDKTNVILGPRMIPIDGPAYLEDSIDHISYRISPLSFYQVNPDQTVKLYHKALEYAGLTGQERVFDLYCGIGTISLFLAQKASHVYGVEIIGAAIDDARENAKLNGIENVSFYTGKSEEVMPRLYEEEGVSADVVVVDPPRKGCDESLLNTIVDMSPGKLVYVSCDPSTLARDVKILEMNGYSLDKVCGCDMFCHSSHVETVCLLNRVHEG